MKITGQDETKSNFQIVNSDQTLESIEKIDSNNNEITFKQINSGTHAIVEIPIKALNEEQYDLSNFSKINNVTLTGKYTGNDAKTINIQKTIQTRNEWTENATPVIEQTVTKYIPYQINEKIGTFLQTTVTTGLENNSLPIQETLLQINVPTINEKKPTKVWVTANSLKATNGQDGIKLEENSWKYDEQTGLLTIHVANKENNNIVSWNKKEKDQYIIGYNYEEKYEEIATTQQAKLSIVAYNNTPTKVEKEDTIQINKKEKEGELITAKQTMPQEITKGILYTKSETGLNYQENLQIEIANNELTDKITINQNDINFLTEKNKYPATTQGETTYKTIKISEENMKKILGEDGSLVIYNSANGEELTQINKQTQKDENGNYVYTYPEQISKIKIETTKPVQSGTLKIEQIKNLKRSNTL